MRRIIDLSYTISEEMPVYPGDPEVHINLVQAISSGGYNVSELCFGAHTGTHIDSPHHATLDYHGVDTLPLDSLVGWAEVLDLGELAPSTEITAAHLDALEERAHTGCRILVKTGWGSRYGTDDFYKNFPGITEGAVAWLTARKVKLLGIEQPSVHSIRHKEVHKALLSGGVIIMESVANMEQLTQDRVFLIAVPLRLKGLDGSPVRAIAVEGDIEG